MKHLMTASILALGVATGAQAEGKLSLYHWFEYIPQELLVRLTATATTAKGCAFVKAVDAD